MKIRFGFSPCPNDTFMFEAIYSKRIDLEGLEFEFVIEDVEALNERAMSSELEVTKLSFNAFTQCTNDYILLRSGSALGNNCGPLLITNQDLSIAQDPNASVAIPGKLTTANLLLSLAYPHLVNKEQVLFSEIEAYVSEQKTDLGLIIHENRFTYEQKGLKKVKDLGMFWESTTGMPIPLGGIVVKRALKDEIHQKINRILRKSIEFARANSSEKSPFVQNQAQEMDQEVLKKHINLYVNEYSLDLGQEGINAIQTLFDLLMDKNIISGYKSPIFIESRKA